MNMIKQFNFKYYYNLLAFALLSVMLLPGCTKNFKDYNTNPNALPVDQINYDNVFLGGFFKQMEESIFPVGGTGSSSTNAYQTAENLCGDIFGGYHGQTHNWNAAGDNTTYNFTIGWNATAFNSFYTNVVKNCDTVNKYAAKNPDILAVAKIIKIEAAHRVVDMYGPLPYFNTGTVIGSLGSEYDSMDSIYYSFFEDLDSAINTLKPFAQLGAAPLRYYDAVYWGNYTQWIKFANSLKLRLAMRIVYVDPVKAQKYAEEAVNDSYGVIEENKDNATMQGVEGVTYTNPLGGLTIDYQEARMSANMQSFLLGYEDPRCARYFNPGTRPSDPANTYRGIRSGSLVSAANTTKYILYSTLKYDFNVIWMPAAEVYFLRAEGALRGWKMGGSKQQLYEKGIELSFSQWGLGSSSSYAANSTSIPAAYTDPLNSSCNVQVGSNLSTIKIAWDEAATFETNLERIITQKWIAIYPNGQEAWSEFRRTRYPKIFPIVNNQSGGTVNTQIQVRRLPYPYSEYQFNAANLAKGITLLGGPDNGGTKLWWDAKP